MSSCFTQTLFHFLKLHLSLRKKETVRKLASSTKLGSWRSKISRQGDCFPPISKGWGENARRKKGRTEREGQWKVTSWLHKTVKITKFLVRLSSSLVEQDGGVIYSGTLLLRLKTEIHLLEGPVRPKPYIAGEQTPFTEYVKIQKLFQRPHIYYPKQVHENFNIVLPSLHPPVSSLQ